jgi:hypothetical protein
VVIGGSRHQLVGINRATERVMEDGQILFNIIVGLAGVFGGWILNNISRSIERLDKDVRSMPLTYVTRADYRADIDEIKMMLNRINDKLDDKADKE